MRWHPDTCGCVVDLTWDKEIPEDRQVHTLSKIITKCAEHQTVKDDELLDVLMDENPRKNRAVAAIIKDYPELEEKDISWKFDSGRVLEVSMNTLDGQRKKALQDKLDVVFTNKKVKVK